MRGEREGTGRDVRGEREGTGRDVRGGQVGVVWGRGWGYVGI